MCNQIFNTLEVHLAMDVAENSVTLFKAIHHRLLELGEFNSGYLLAATHKLLQSCQLGIGFGDKAMLVGALLERKTSASLVTAPKRFFRQFVFAINYMLKPVS